MTNRSLACAAATVGFALGGCGSTSTSAGTSSLHVFRLSFAAAQHQLHSISVDLGFTVTHAGINADVQRATQLSALAFRAEREASALEELDPPTQYNTRLRALGSTLDAVAADLMNISTAATEHNAPATESATHALRVDAANVKSADATESKSLGLPAG
jgi:hypothetical protein